MHTLRYETKACLFKNNIIEVNLFFSPNVYRTPKEALQAFEWFDKAGDWDQHFSSWERYLVIYLGAFVMWIIGKRLKKRHNLKDDVS